MLSPVKPIQYPCQNRTKDTSKTQDNTAANLSQVNCDYCGYDKEGSKNNCTMNFPFLIFDYGFFNLNLPLLCILSHRN